MTDWASDGTNFSHVRVVSSLLKAKRPICTAAPNVLYSSEEQVAVQVMYHVLSLVCKRVWLVVVLGHTGPNCFCVIPLHLGNNIYSKLKK